MSVENSEVCLPHCPQLHCVQVRTAAALVLASAGSLQCAAHHLVTVEPMLPVDDLQGSCAVSLEHLGFLEVLFELHVAADVSMAASMHVRKEEHFGDLGDVQNLLDACNHFPRASLVMIFHLSTSETLSWHHLIVL
eukprot:CAMPEP_0177414710 /NCGR_PEP_ID=MMETSP0368-20130122/67199_1 /TAXON_ID=447022 ORGANISM="Scrippsiella hangoei-like, Strain SHHI-4" /NCGR_SAMPLE_ID=MMETSP0368 /ASSEMBLY_ACC=CAM_ASM_000363 /LENGTH=135 /DNA_ID=CAMNT_0018884117 /DNA_START=77 /DNA_END=480 /DNA_ORIENTATION=-